MLIVLGLLLLLLLLLLCSLGFGVGWYRLFTPPILSHLLGEANIRSRKESLADSCSVLCCGWPGPLPMGPCFPGLENKKFWGWMFEAGLRQGPCASSKTEEVIPSNGTKWPWCGGDWMPSHQAACLILYKSHSLTGSLPAVCSVTGRQGLDVQWEALSGVGKSSFVFLFCQLIRCSHGSNNKSLRSKSPCLCEFLEQ